mmetsp:Transcript_20232/g.17912  ORF Transcript_20232/g.17912 Transcript_20232/m.17912 type:complete len:82 (-) Transcript_20232:44-289(-)
MFLHAERNLKSKIQSKRPRRNRDDRKKANKVGEKVHQLDDHSVDRKLSIRSKPYILQHKPSLLSSPHRAQISLGSVNEVHR